jgi:pilus assembly protein FimV
MFRKAGIGFAALAMMAPGIASALGVGDYELRSYLNQPLEMEVSLTDTDDLTSEEILVSLASQKDFDTAGVDRAYFLTDLNFNVEVDEEGNGTLVIRSTQPVREPFLNFLVEVMWPTGRMLREYTVLLDPPSYEGASVQATAPAASEQPAAEPETVQSQPAPATDTVVAPAPASQAPAPVASQQSEAPASQPAGTYTGPREEYVVQADDTMWSIALRSRPRSSISVQQMLVAIQELNPDAFIDGNVNLVREGTVLRLPSEEEVRRIRTRDALTEIADQNRAWREKLEARGITLPARPQVDGTRRGDTDGEAAGKPTEGKVTLVTPSEGGTGKGVESAAGSEGADTAALENELAIRDENIDSMQRENAELSSRIADLKGQIETSEKLLELRNNQIAQLEEQLRQLQAEQGIEPTESSVVDSVEDATAQAEAEAQDAAADTADESGETATAMAGADSEDAAATDGAGEGAAAEDTAEADQVADSAAGTDMADETADGGAADADAQPVTRPEPVKPVRPQPEPAPEPGIVQLLMDNLMLVVGAIVALLVVIGGIIFMRNRQKGEADADAVADLDELDDTADDDFFVDGIDEQGDEEGFGELEEPSEDTEEPAGQDPLEEVDVYTAYGRHAEAVTFLQNEIDKAPRRSDLKVRLLEVLAEMNDADGFEREASRFADDDEVAARVDALRAGLSGASAAADEEVSLDDLEMDLSSGLNDAPAAQAAAEEPAEAEQDEDMSLDFDMDLGGGEEPEAADDDATLVLDAAADAGDDSADELGDFDLDLGDDSADDDQTDTLSLDAGDDEFSLDLEDTSTDRATDEDDLTLSLDTGDEEAAEEPSDDLDAALEMDSSLDLGSSDEELSLDMDDEEVSLDDVSSEFSEVAEEPASEDIDLSLDDLEFDGGDTAAEAEEEAPTEVGMPAVEDEPAPSSDTVQRESVEQAGTDIRPAVDAADVDDDDFDFLGDTDENATKLDLAKAYIDMGDAEGARDILNEVVSEGNPEQQQEAKELLSQVS